MSSLPATHQGLLLKRMEECVDGDYQRFKAKDGAYLRAEFFGKYPELLKMVEDKTDEELATLHRGGHDQQKIYNAYKRAVEHKGAPTVILAHTVKGYGIASAQSRNPTHSEKKLADEALAAFVKHFNIPLPEEAAKNADFYRPGADDPVHPVPAGAPRRTRRLPARTRSAKEQLRSAQDRLLRDLAWPAPRAAPSPPPWASSIC